MLLAYLLFIILAFLAFVVFFLRPEEGRLRRDQEDVLRVQARQLASLARLTPTGPVWTGELAPLARLADLRLTLIAADGAVVGDSSYDAAEMDNHGGRPEIKAALSGRIAVNHRYSRTLRANLVYLAVPLRAGGLVVGALRVAKTQREIDRVLIKLRVTFLGGALAAVLISMILGWFVLRSLTSPLRAIEQAASRFGAGEFGTRVRDFGQDELGLLARSFNRMASHLDRLITNLDEERGKLLTILSTMDDGVIVFDHRQLVILANRGAASFLGLTEEKMLGRTPAELLLPPAALELIKRTVKEKTGSEGEFEVHLPVRRTISTVLSPIRHAEPRFLGTLMLLRDMTNLRHLERVRQDFVANVSHELRTPLTAIKVMVETMLQGGLNQEKQLGFLASMDAECDRLNALVGDLLTLAKLDSGTVKAHEELFALGDLIRETSERLFPLGTKRRPLIELVPDLPMAKADPDQIRQILINLLDNAVKYSPDQAAFGVQAAGGEDWITVTVWDEGPGIPEEDRERIFERFYRVDKARSRSLGGTGLGLSIVRHLVEGYGGRVWVENGRGARFNFTVPRAGSG